MDKKYAIWIVSKIAQDLERLKCDLPSYMYEILEEELILGNMEKVFNWVNEYVKNNKKLDIYDILRKRGE